MRTSRKLKKAFETSKPLGKTTAADSPMFESKDDAREASNVCVFEKREYARGSQICSGGKVFVCGPNGWYANGKNC